MALDAWLPIGFKLPDGAKGALALFEGPDWQISKRGRRARAGRARTRWRNIGWTQA
jgi:cell division protease FtsH